MNLKGSLPTLILESLTRGPSHGYEIASSIKRRSHDVLDFKEGTLYPALHTLERDGMVSSTTETENGRTRRYYQLTDKGNKHLEKSRLEWQKMSRAIDGILGGAA
ncbi:MAG: PadR family transcriptional regulator [Pleurocapsa sp. SU_196_0]|nr:PadR family transcriptional regulator [Pleurocapsa sp. SU_196_0]